MRRVKCELVRRGRRRGYKVIETPRPVTIPAQGRLHGAGLFSSRESDRGTIPPAAARFPDAVLA